MERYTNPARLNCVHIECPEYFTKLKPECIKIRSLNSCCSEQLVALNLFVVS